MRKVSKSSLMAAAAAASLVFLQCGNEGRSYEAGGGSAGSAGEVGEGGDSSAGASSQAGSEPTAGTQASGGTRPNGGSPSVAGSSSGGGAGAGGSAGTGAAGAGGSGGADDPACPAAEPDLLSSFENNSFDVCPPRAGFWAFSSLSVMLPCPVIDVCSIASGGTAAHPHVLAFVPPGEAAGEGLILDLRAGGAAAADAGSYTGLSLSALGSSVGSFELRIEAYTSDNVYHEDNVGGEPGGACVEPAGDCGIPYETLLGIDGVAWQELQVPFTSLTRDVENNPVAFDAGKLLYLRFSVVGEFPFSVDDVALSTN